jgi:phosphosulfolactate synthase (CoM biosynthesis protein A)
MDVLCQEAETLCEKPLTGYFGGVGVPNEYTLKWVEEFLHYYTEYGVQQVLNVNTGTVMLGYLLYKLGIDIEFA